MKKIFFIVTTLLLAMLSSCNQEERVNATESNDRVCLSAELPGSISVTRAQITVPATHQLRCIVEVWTKSTTPALKYREEKAVKGGAIPSFDFALPPGDYTCLLWADFIERDAVTISITTEEVTYNHFADTFYDTSDLHAITIKEVKGGNLFDTDLCDGFFAKQELLKGETPIAKQCKLLRPFGKLIVKENNSDKFGELQTMKVSYQLPKGFNVEAGEPLTEKLLVTYEKSFEADEASQVLFTNYIFAPSSTGGQPLSTVVLSFTTKGRADCEIPEGSIIVKRNQRTNASGNLIIGEGIDPEPEPTDDPKVGDYFFADGTWGAELTEANKKQCVGIVFATGEQAGDDAANYGTGKQILGYVMALESIYGTPEDGLVQNESLFSGRIYWYNTKSDLYETLFKTFPYIKPLDVDNFNGYAKTESYFSSESYKAHRTDFYFPALQIFETWRGKQPAIARASKWYIPSFKQLSIVVGGCYGYAALNSQFQFPAVEKIEALSNAFEAAKTQEIAKNFTTGNHFLFSSTISLKQPAEEPIVIVCNNTSAGIKPQQVNKPAGVIRPILTIIK